MDNNENQDRERDFRDRIASFMRVEAQARGKPATVEELQILQFAVGRLDQVLANAVADDQTARRVPEEEARTLRSAAARLDQLIADIT